MATWRRRVLISSVLVLSVVALVTGQTLTQFTGALTALKNQINGTAVLTGSQIMDRDSIIDTGDSLFIASSDTVLRQAFNLIALYDSVIGGSGLFSGGGWGGAGSFHSSQCRRIFSITRASSMNAMTFIVPPHFGHISGSTS
jgi:hypothetical protein